MAALGDNAQSAAMSLAALAQGVGGTEAAHVPVPEAAHVPGPDAPLGVTAEVVFANGLVHAQVKQREARAAYNVAIANSIDPTLKTKKQSLDAQMANPAAHILLMQTCSTSLLR